MIIGNIMPTNASAGDWSINGDLHVKGSLTVDLDQYVYRDSFTSDPIIVLNYIPISGAPIFGVDTRLSGIEIDRGQLPNYQLVFDENDDSMRIGMVGDLQAVATREDTPIDTAFGFWNDTAKRFDTDPYFTTSTVVTYNDLTVANLSGALDSHYVNKAGDTMTGDLLMSNSTSVVIDSFVDNFFLLRTDATGRIEESGVKVVNSPVGGSGIALAEYSTPPDLNTAPTGFIWIESVNSTTKKLCFYNGSDKFSVELASE
jgi:hypothetical protein